MADVSASFDRMMDMDLWVDAVVVLAAFLAPTVLHNVAEGMVPMDLPDEAYGIAIVALSAFAPSYKYHIGLGGGLYTVDKAAERADLKSTVSNLGA